MGAEFIGGLTPIRKNREQAQEALKVLSREEVARLVQESYAAADDDESAEEYAEQALSLVYDAYEGNRRDGDVWEIDGTKYVVSGGLSWGDAPTELCEAVWVVDALGVTK